MTQHVAHRASDEVAQGRTLQAQDLTPGRTATKEWRGLVHQILRFGNELRQEGRGHEPRDRTTKELLAWRTTWPMSQPAVRCRLRKASGKLMLAEAAWVACGSSRLSEIAPYARHYAHFSDDGAHLSGAYGPKFVDQLPYVVQSLARDQATRQAVGTFWRERPGPSKDVPCTIGLQWVVRGGALHCLATMRSSDAWLGVPYDVVTFSALSACVAAELWRLCSARVALGTLVLTAGSQHLYARDWEAARKCAELARVGEVEEETAPHDAEAFGSAEDVAAHLWALARGQKAEGWLAGLAASGGGGS